MALIAKPKPMNSVHRSSSLDQKKDWNQTELNCKRLDHWLWLHKFWNFSVASCDICRKIKRPKKTGLLLNHVLDLIHTHIYLIFGLWIIKNGQELVDIWPKTFLYTTWMYVSSVFAISQSNLNKIAWNFNQSTENWNIHLCMQCMWGNICFIWYNKFYNKRLVTTSLDRFFSCCGLIRTGL